MRIFKRCMTVILLLCFSVNCLAALAADPSQPVGTSVIRPAMSKIETYLIGDDFDGSTIHERWANMERVQQTDGNYIGKINPNKIVTFGVGKMWLSDFTLRMNFKVDYEDDGWCEILDVKYRDENSKVKIMLNRTADHNSSRIILQTVGQASNLWYTYNIPANHSIYSGEWQFIKVTVKGDAINIYLNSDDTPIIEATGLSLPNAAIGFKPFASTIYIDNLLVSRAKDLPAVTVKPDVKGKAILAQQDFEKEPFAESGFLGGSVAVDEDETCYRLTSPVTSGKILGRNYDIEFNLLAEYTVAQEFTVTVDADEAGNGYSFVLGSDGNGGSSFRFVKKSAGSDKTDEVTQEKGDGFANWSEANHIWAYFKIEKRDDVIKLYFNHKEKAAYTITDSAPLTGGSFHLDTAALTSCCIDNFTVTSDLFSKRMQVESITDGKIRITSSYPEQKEAELLVLYYKDDALTGIASTEMRLVASVPDGRNFAVTELAFDRDLYESDHVEAYIIDTGVNTESFAEATAICEDNDLSISGAVGGLRGDDMLILIRNAEDGHAADARILNTDRDGRFSYAHQFEFGEYEGEYEALIYDGKSALPLKMDFQYLSDTNLAIFLENLNAARENEIAFSELLDEKATGLYLRRMGVFLREFEMLGGFDKHTLWKLLDSASVEVFDRDNTGSEMNAVIFAAMVQDASSADKIKALYEEFCDLVKISDEITKEYEARKDKLSSDVFDGLYRMRGNCTSLKNAAELFESQFVLAYIFKSGYMDIYALLDKYADKIGIDLSCLPSSEAERNRIMQKLNVRRCDSYNEFVKLYQASLPNSSGSSSGSGGNSGGGKVSTAISAGEQNILYNAEPNVMQKISYSDVEPEYWAYEYIVNLSNLGIVRGYEDERFYPERELSRAELCKLLTTAFELTGGKSGSFDDVTETDWHYSYITAAKSAGLVTGIGNGKFEPDEVVSRQDMAVILCRLMKNKGMKIKNKDTGMQNLFRDMDTVSDYARDSVVEMAAAGILNGDGGIFAPQRGTTRAEAAKIVYCVLDRIKGETVE